MSLTARQLVDNQRKIWNRWDDGPINAHINAQWRAREAYEDDANRQRMARYDAARGRGVIIGKSCVVVSWATKEREWYRRLFWRCPT